MADLLRRRTLSALRRPRAAASSMMARTRCSDSTFSSEDAPQLERSSGISSVSSQRPFTWPNRSSCGRTAGSMPGRASSSIVMPPTLTGGPEMHWPIPVLSRFT